ncbi:MAG: CDP-diacylglycerol--glycerol-3-phosphate 3-phosphatidyltransferase [Candidatus Omnitrophica bacterium]|nr:CDP-diacylglycerol--glycerol-3-phosphate 3-phosphatidyltransferase [Candidatus Omnitrophota bacterium]
MTEKSIDVPIHPNVLTVGRIFLSVMIPPLFLRGTAGARALGLLLVVLGILTDWWDGLLARKGKLETSTGKILDPIADKMLVLGILFTNAHLGLYPFWMPAVIAAREILVTAVRFKYLKEKRVVAAEWSGKVKTGLQFGSIGASFLYWVVRDFAPGSSLIPFLAGLNLVGIVLAVAVTFYSGFSFFREDKRVADLLESFVSCLYIGFIPVAPGTFGSLAGVAVLLVLPQNPVTLSGVLLSLFFLSVLASGRYAQSRSLKDPSTVVIDEVCGMMTSLYLLPLSLSNVALGFVLFRIFDVLKPFPVRNLEKLPAGWGIVADDIAAGIYVNLILRLLGVVWG